MRATPEFTPRRTTVAIASALALMASAQLALGAGNKPPTGETAVNNLSYPAVEINGAGPAATLYFAPAASPVLGQDFSYGCDVPETIEESTYPNTSCVSADGRTYYTPEQCVALVPNCAGTAIADFSRIYWQKTASNDWTADASLSGLGRDAKHLDWGDNLESTTWWTTAQIRVETTPFGAIDPTQQGLQMWHVAGKGQTELWGVRATEPTAGAAPQPYVYDSAYAILHTSQARLNIAKMSGPVDCKAAVPPLPPAQGEWSYTDTGGAWSGRLLTLYDVPYTAELNVGGKYVYGFNWQLRRDTVDPAIGKAGWWRLTFYSRTSDTATSAVVFDDPAAVVLAPPESPAASPLVASMSEAAIAPHGLSRFAIAEAETSAYTPVVLGEPEHLSYIDICISDSKGGGGSKGGRK